MSKVFYPSVTLPGICDGDRWLEKFHFLWEGLDVRAPGSIGAGVVENSKCPSVHSYFICKHLENDKFVKYDFPFGQ